MAFCLERSHREISTSRAKQLLMLDTDEQLKSFVDRTSTAVSTVSVSMEDSDMGIEGDRELQSIQEG